MVLLCLGLGFGDEAMRDFIGPGRGGNRRQGSPRSARSTRCKILSRPTVDVRRKATTKEGVGRVNRSSQEFAIEAGNLGACWVSSKVGLNTSLPLRLARNLRLYLSSPSQNLDLRTDSIWLSRAENDLQICPLGARSSVYFRTRICAYRTPSGRLLGPSPDSPISA
jgi:hypothetical protein